MIKLEKEKSYTVKDWFAKKIAEELGKSTFCTEIFAVIRETDKAVYAMLNLGFMKKKTMWIPKSVIVEDEKDHGTMICSDYDECSKAFSSMWEEWR